MEELYEYRRRLLDDYVASVKELGRIMALRSPTHWRSHLQPGGWSLHQVASHLRKSELGLYQPVIQRILSEDMPVLADWDGTNWGEVDDHSTERLEDIMIELVYLRESQSARLKELPAEVWNRMGRHPKWGLRSLQWWVEHNWAHTEEHLKEFLLADV